MRQSKQQFREYLVRKGLKTTKQREIILDAFLRASTHPSTEELFLKIRRKHPTVGYATVYRTLKLFADCGIAEERNFGDGQTRYEWIGDETHHDHLICTSCGAILEFEDPHIEKLQREVADRHGFTIVSHRLELYGLCSHCNSQS